MPDDIKCTNQCQLHKDIKDILDKHDKVIYGDGVDKDGLLTRVSSLLTVRTLVYSCVGLILIAFLTGVVGLVWRGAK